MEEEVDATERKKQPCAAVSVTYFLQHLHFADAAGIVSTMFSIDVYRELLPFGALEGCKAKVDGLFLPRWAPLRFAKFGRAWRANAVSILEIPAR